MENQKQTTNSQNKVIIFENYRHLIQSKNSKAICFRCFLFRSTKCEVRMILSVDFKKVTK